MKITTPVTTYFTQQRIVKTKVQICHLFHNQTTNTIKNEKV